MDGREYGVCVDEFWLCRTSGAKQDGGRRNEKRGKVKIKRKENTVKEGGRENGKGKEKKIKIWYVLRGGKGRKANRMSSLQCVWHKTTEKEKKNRKKTPPKGVSSFFSSNTGTPPPSLPCISPTSILPQEMHKFLPLPQLSISCVRVNTNNPSSNRSPAEYYRHVPFVAGSMFYMTCWGKKRYIQ